MDNYDLPFDAMQYKLKTARQKKRLQKTDFDKQLIQIVKQREQYWAQRIALPWIPLEIPYQRGWKRHFVLRKDIKRLAIADFYEELLKHINTVQYAADKSFKTRRRRRRKRTKEERKQLLHEFPELQWDNTRYNRLTADEKAHFHLYELWDNDRKTSKLFYRFNEPWRYVLKIVPHMITHTKMLDEQLERDIQKLANYIEGHNLEPRISRLTHGSYQYQSWSDLEKPSYIELKKDASLQVNEAMADIKKEKI